MTAKPPSTVTVKTEELERTFPWTSMITNFTQGFLPGASSSSSLVVSPKTIEKVFIEESYSPVKNLSPAESNKSPPPKSAPSINATAGNVKVVTSPKSLQILLLLRKKRKKNTKKRKRKK